MANAVGAVNNLMRDYVTLRGGEQSTVGWKKTIPNTTWGDVIVAAYHIQKYIDPTTAQCVEILTEEGRPITEAAHTCIFGGRGENPSSFEKTKDFRDARASFHKTIPSLDDAIPRFQEIYPRNEEFWNAALTYSVARSAAGEVPFFSEKVIESLEEVVIKRIEEGLPSPPSIPWAKIAWFAVGITSLYAAIKIVPPLIENRREKRLLSQ